MGKRKLTDDQYNEDATEPLPYIEEHGRQKSKKKKKKHNSSKTRNELLLESECNGLEDTCNTPNERLGDNNQKKKKKRKADTELSSSKTDQESGMSEFLGANSLTEETYTNTNDGKPRKKSKKFKKNSDDGSNEVEEATAAAEIINGDIINELGSNSKKTKKKKKKRKGEDKDHDIKHAEGIDNTVDENGNSSSNLCQEKINHLYKNDEEQTNKEQLNREKKKKSKKAKAAKSENHTQEEEKQQTLPLTANGNCLQSGEVIDSGVGGNKNPAVGQWQTANFDDENRQNKFIKLLGGYKKGCDKKALGNKFFLNGNKMKHSSEDSKNNEDGNAENKTMAMTKIQEKMYMIALESQYEKAKQFNQKRGTGLGFEKPPEEGKKFHIDVTKSKSVKFD